MKNIVLISLISALSFSLVYSQVYNPVKWEVTAKKVSENEIDLVLTATIEQGWKLFSQEMTDEGPVPTSVTLARTNTYEPLNNPSESENRKEEFSHIFGINVLWFESYAVITQRVKVLDFNATISGEVEFMACNKDKCLPPATRTFSINLKTLKGANVSQLTVENQ